MYSSHQWNRETLLCMVRSIQIYFPEHLHVFIRKSLSRESCVKQYHCPPHSLLLLVGGRGQQPRGHIPLHQTGYQCCHSHTACWFSCCPRDVWPPPCCCSRPRPRMPQSLAHIHFHRPTYSTTLSEEFLYLQEHASPQAGQDRLAGI